MKGCGRGERQGLPYVPEQFVERTHDAEGGEHRGCGSGCVAPGATAEGDLHDVLAGAEAVVDRATREPLGPQPVVDVAAEVAGEVGAGAAGRLVDGEVGGAGKCRYHAAEA